MARAEPTDGGSVEAAKKRVLACQTAAGPGGASQTGPHVQHSRAQPRRDPASRQRGIRGKGLRRHQDQRHRRPRRAAEANVYYYFKSKENLYREVLESIVEPLLEASAPFNQPCHPAEVLRAYIRTKIRISRDHAYASKVFASEIMHGAPHLSPERTAQLNAQAAHNIACIQGWIDQGLMAPIDPSHLLFSIWAATQTYADFDWQISTVTGKARLDEADYDAAADTIIRTVLRGCEIAEPTAA